MHGYFKYCRGILFGRPLIVREDYEMKYFDAIKQALGDLDVPIVYDADIGHVPPQMPIVNGAVLKVKNEDGKFSVKTNFKY